MIRQTGGFARARPQRDRGRTDERLRERQVGIDSELLTIGIDEPHFAGAYSVVYPDLAGSGGDAALLPLEVLAIQDRCQKRPIALHPGSSGGP